MKLLIEIFLFSIPLVFLTWMLPKRYVLLSQILLTSFFILYKSPLSFCVISITAFGNYYLLHKSKLNTSIKINISLVFLILMIIIAKVYVTINNNWVIPLGLSYYTFRNIHYTIEVYKGKIQQENLLHYLAYNFFLPSFIVGPINRYHDFIKDWNRRRFNKDQFSLGLERILYGSSKIIILGNYFFTLKANQFIENIDSKYVWLKTFLETSCFILNGFFKFAGYSDIAIGLSLLIGFRIMENFNYPFFATNMRDFWSRYHISLSSFCKDYIYTPIASHTRNATKAIIITMLVIGLWHEISIRYILWGIFQAIGIYSSSFIKINSNSFIAQYAGRLFVFVFFALSCVIVSHDTLTESLNTYKILFFLK